MLGILLRNIISLSFFVREVLDVGWLVIQKLIARLLFLFLSRGENVATLLVLPGGGVCNCRLVVSGF